MHRIISGDLLNTGILAPLEVPWDTEAVYGKENNA